MDTTLLCPFIFFRRKKAIPTYQKGPMDRKADNRKQDNGDLVNERIRFPKVLVIGPNGPLGEMTRNDALRKADEYSLDLLCVNPKGNPPVCKLVDYGKYRFEAQKKAKEAKKNQKIIDVKEVQLTPQIGVHDLETKAKAAIKFLQEGNKVKVGVRFKGRQLSHTEIGDETLSRFLEYVKDYANVEKAPALDGKWLTCVLSAKKTKEKENAKDEK